MNWLPFTFLQPWWLLLLLVLPLVVGLSARSLAGLGPIRRWLAIAIRSVILILLAAALADVQFVRRADKRATLFIVDQSQSVPNDWSERALDLISNAINRRTNLEDEAGVIVYGKEARLELPPYRYPTGFKIVRVESTLDRQYTDLSAAIKLALGSFPSESAKRIVVISDGNQNRGDAIAQAVAAKNNDIPIDVVPIEYQYDSEVLVDKIVLPPDLKKGDTANLKIVIRSARSTSGQLRLTRTSESGTEAVGAPQQVNLERGINVFFVPQTIVEPDFYTYEAKFEPADAAGDRLARNNQATAFTWIRGEGKILLIEQAIGDHQTLVDKLRQDGLQVRAMRADQIRGDLAEFRQYDAVIVANVPADLLDNKTQEALVANTFELGAGLVMIGGPDSFGAGGYIGSPIEKALPVDLEIKSTKITGKGALVLIMHACEMPEGNYWEKVVAKKAVEAMSSRDECGLLIWAGDYSWLFPLQPVGDKKRMLARIDTMTPSDMPDFQPTMQMAFDKLRASNAMTKHCIIISDGDPQPPPDSLLQAYKNAKISVSTVGIATHGGTDRAVMRRIATMTGGNYHNVTNAAALPQIYIKETRVVSRPLIFEREPGWQPRMTYPTELVAGLPPGLPAIKGFVLTSPKSAPGVQIPIVSPVPAENEINPLLAHWQYGLGRVVAFTSDSGAKWAAAWSNSEIYSKFWSQVVRWSMRSAESENLAVSVVEDNGKAKVVVNAVDTAKDDEFLNFLKLNGSLILPGMGKQSLDFKQTEPGKYEAAFNAEQAGSYFLSIGYQQANGGTGFVSTGINISYPPEYRDLESNRELLENIAAITDGRTIEWSQADDVDFFPKDRVPPQSLQFIWPILLLSALTLFFFDVGVRRIAIEPRDVASRVLWLWNKLRRKKIVGPTSATMERLRSIKAEVSEQLKQRRFEAEPAKEQAKPAGPSITEAPAAKTAEPPKKPEPTASESLAPSKEEAAPENYTSRLLKAKKKVWEQRDETKS